MEMLGDTCIRSVDKLINLLRDLRYIILLPLTPILEPFLKWVARSAIGVELDGDGKYDIKIKDKRFYPHIMAYGILGVGEAYMNGWWDTEDLRKTMEMLISPRTMKVLCWYKCLPYYWESQWLWVWWNRQKRTGLVCCDKQYNLPVEFFQQFSDTYIAHSCAYYGAGGKGLDETQVANRRNICTKLGLKRGMKVLDVGCGFGGLAKFMVEEYGVEVLGITNSTGMAKVATDLCKNTPGASFEACDWREMKGTYDAITCIEMSEHVGLYNLEPFFQKIHSMLKPDGRFLLQVGTFEGGMLETDEFVNKYLYGPLSCARGVQGIITFAKDFELLDLQNYRGDYLEMANDVFYNYIKNWDKIEGIIGAKGTRAVFYVYVSIELAFQSQFCGAWQFVFRRNGAIIPGWVKRVEPVKQ